MKLLFKIFLSLVVLLSGMHSTGYAHTADQENIMYVPARSVKHASYIVPPFSLLGSLPAANYRQPVIDHIHLSGFSEDSEDPTDPTSTCKKKKGAAGGNYFATLYGVSSKYLSNYVIECLPVCRHFSFTAAYTQVLLCVFRI